MYFVKLVHVCAWVMIFGDVFFCKTFCSQVVELVLFVDVLLYFWAKLFSSQLVGLRITLSLLAGAR